MLQSTRKVVLIFPLLEIYLSQSTTYKFLPTIYFVLPEPDNWTAESFIYHEAMSPGDSNQISGNLLSYGEKENFENFFNRELT